MSLLHKSLYFLLPLRVLPCLLIYFCLFSVILVIAANHESLDSFRYGFVTRQKPMDGF